MTHSGLLAKAAPVTIANLKRVPAAAHLLSTVLTTLAGLARALGAVAVPAAALDAH